MYVCVHINVYDEGGWYLYLRGIRESVCGSSGVIGRDKYEKTRVIQMLKMSQ